MGRGNDGTQKASKVIPINTKKKKGRQSKINRDGNDSIRSLHDKLTHHAFALRAFGALIKTSNLEEFCDGSNVEAVNMRHGLSQLIDLYLLYQEDLVHKHMKNGSAQSNQKSDSKEVYYGKK